MPTRTCIGGSAPVTPQATSPPTIAAPTMNAVRDATPLAPRMRAPKGGTGAELVIMKGGTPRADAAYHALTPPNARARRLASSARFQGRKNRCRLRVRPASLPLPAWRPAQPTPRVAEATRLCVVYARHRPRSPSPPLAPQPPERTTPDAESPARRAARLHQRLRPHETARAGGSALRPVRRGDARARDGRCQRDRPAAAPRLPERRNATAFYGVPGD